MKANAPTHHKAIDRVIGFGNMRMFIISCCFRCFWFTVVSTTCYTGRAAQSAAEFYLQHLLIYWSYLLVRVGRNTKKNTHACVQKRVVPMLRPIKVLASYIHITAQFPRRPRPNTKRPILHAFTISGARATPSWRGYTRVGYNKRSSLQTLM